MSEPGRKRPRLPITNTVIGSAIASWIGAHPIAILILISALFGPITIAMTPPLRGPDELPHFMRAYGISVGAIVPRLSDEHGHKGILLPAKLDQEIKLYTDALRPLYEEDSATFPEVLTRYARSRASIPPISSLVFAPYAGSEGYSPVPYLPYLPALIVAHFLDLDFVSTVYLMRAVGFIVLTIVMAFAIFLVPDLKWAFVLITFIPSALFSRSVLSTDGSALAFTMLLTAASLRTAHEASAIGTTARSLFMALCVLSKPPQLIFVLFEGLRSPVNFLTRDWKTTAIVVLPAVALSLCWVLASSADVAAWRFVEGSDLPSEHYQPLWKLRYLLGHPLHFFVLLAGTYDYVDDYWLQLIGILGWLDMPLRTWVYPLLSGILLVSFYVPIQVDSNSRRRVIVIGAITTVGYILGVFFIFYLVWTGMDQTRVQGVQGRYFVVLLPTIAMIIAAFAKRGLSRTNQPQIAIIGALLSCWSTLDAVARSEWKLSLLPF